MSKFKDMSVSQISSLEVTHMDAVKLFHKPYAFLVLVYTA